MHDAAALARLRLYLFHTHMVGLVLVTQLVLVWNTSHEVLLVISLLLWNEILLLVALKTNIWRVFENRRSEMAHLGYHSVLVRHRYLSLRSWILLVSGVQLLLIKERIPPMALRWLFGVFVLWPTIFQLDGCGLFNFSNLNTIFCFDVLTLVDHVILFVRVDLLLLSVDIVYVLLLLLLRLLRNLGQARRLLVGFFVPWEDWLL